MKKIKKISIYAILVLLLISLIYITNIQGIPNNIILFQGESLKLSTVFGLNISRNEYGNYETIQVSSNPNNSGNISEKTGKVDLELSILGAIPIKDITVNVIPKTTVIPLRKQYRT